MLSRDAAQLQWQVQINSANYHLAFFSGVSIEGDFNRHELWVDDVDPVAVAEPHLGVHLHHAPDAVVRLAQVKQVVIPQIPLPVRCPMEDRHRAVGQSCQHSAFHVDDGKDRVLETNGMDAPPPLGDR